ncbi:snRNA-activating protein complex subunit 3 [Topomyia yanbarensis]|uniref:snRNA-activating protein complex subunit 3 n=1 Tax=Topomyia yanbarensis TaxID=2498891 RepID=UPI00273A7D77|nr:snRNA-activating protein complex subunit 3 [Topomyia yanbarensis]XP_058821545.1 snRNA-activating protein complex subunit 3 [Topomyia yanbarensis]XP_058821546.1 snRNA-activating protein complex subunit 3 [Topomyia yanbarensis]
MERIYRPKCSKVISVRQALREFHQELLPDGWRHVPTTKDDIATAMGFSGTEQEFNELLQAVDLDQHLSSTKDIRISSFHPARVQNVQKPAEIPEKANRFNCVQHALKITGKFRKNLDSKIRYNKHKYSCITRSDEPDLEPYMEILLEIRFYEPFKYKPGIRLGHPKFHQEFYVLGTQFLTELRDKIYCQCDLGPFFDISENPHINSIDKNTNVESRPNPGFFFIHDTFYNDLRNEDSYDYSEVIRSWAERQKNVGELRTRRMEETKFEDIFFRLGYPQVYQHHGNCEHIFVVSDCRLLATSDVLLRKRYPILNSYAFPRSIPCNICGHCEANYIVKNSDQHIFDPAYVCEVCFQSYHYKDGKKLGEFEAFRFLGTKIAVKEDEFENDSHP